MASAAESSEQDVGVTEDAHARVSLMDIMVGVAFAAMWCGVLNPSLEGFNFGQQLAAGMAFLIQLLIVFSGTTGLFLFARRWVRMRPIDFQPGHWWLCLLGCFACFLLLTHGTERTAKEFIDWQRDRQLAFGIAVLIGNIVLWWGVGLLLPVRKVWWLTLIPQTILGLATIGLFGAVLAGYQAHGSYYFELFKPWMLMFDMLVLVVIGVWDRWTTNNRRDWLHWWGVITAMLLSGGDLLLRTIYGLGWVR